MDYKAVGTRENVNILSRDTFNGMTVEVLEYKNLVNSYTRLKQVAVYLENDGCKIEPGAMSYFQGNLEMVSGVTLGNALGRVFRGAVTGEATAQPEYTGTGMLVLEPTYDYYMVLSLDPGESIIVDKGMFFCAQKSVTVKPIMNSTISSALLGGEGVFQQELIGPGLVVLESKAPSDEIEVIELKNDTLKVDGNFAILRTGNIQFTVERSAKTLVGSAVSGEGLVNVYKGTGQVWLAPMLKAPGYIRLDNIMGITGK